MGTLQLGWLDSSILLAYVVILACIGWWAAHRTVKTTDDYFLASRSIPWFITLASFIATCISALTFVGTPGEGYSSDFRFLLSNPGDILATFFIAGVFLPHFQKLRVTSIYQAISERFGPSSRTACSAYFLITRTLASTVRIVAIAKVLEVVSGGAIPYTYCVMITVGAVLAYTTLGGGRAIAWTDTMQFFLLFGGAIAALIYLVHLIPGGVGAIIEVGKHAVKPDGTVYNKFNFMEMYKPANLGLTFLMIVWGFFNSSASYGTDQDMVQRLLACNDPKKARMNLLIWGLAGIPITLLFLSIGASLYAYAQIHPAFVAGMKDTDHVFPRFILTAMPPGLRGLMLAAVASAAMGSADSALASLATAFTMDFYRPYFAKSTDEATHVKASKISFFFFGLLFMVLAMALRNLDSLLWLAFRLIAFTYGPLLGVFLVAILTNWKLSSKKIIAMMLSCTALTLTLGLTAWWQSTHGAVGFWKELHGTYWRLYIIFGALAVPAVSYFIREEV